LVFGVSDYLFVYATATVVAKDRTQQTFSNQLLESASRVSAARSGGQHMGPRAWLVRSVSSVNAQSMSIQGLAMELGMVALETRLAAPLGTGNLEALSHLSFFTEKVEEWLLERAPDEPTGSSGIVNSCLG
jgi:hypothetical protein